MDVTLLQHAKDTSPQAVTVAQVADLIRGSQWPPGYQPVMLVQGVFEGGVRQQDLTRMSGLAVAEFKFPGPSSPPGDRAADGVGHSVEQLREEARADPHTLLLFGTPQSLTIVYAYELDEAYELRQQRAFYRKAYLYGNDYYEHLLHMTSERRGRGHSVTLVHDADVYYQPDAVMDAFLAWEVKDGCQHQASRPRCTEGLRERKSNYRENNMSLDEMEQWLREHIELRRNVVTQRKEFRWIDDSQRSGYGPWQNFDDEAYNDVWRQLQKIKNTKDEHLRKTVDSGFVTDFNPFVDYMQSLPPWDGDDHIRALAMAVTVDGDLDEWLRFVECLRKWLVAMVAGWLHPEVVNHEVLVFIGRQGIYKTSWMNALLPPPLRSYFSTLSGLGDNLKDEDLALTQYGLISCEELDTLTRREMNKMKRAVTLLHVNVRPPYGRYTVRRKHIASFCATGNNEKFLNDPTGTRRWLAFKVVDIASPLTLPFDYEGIYAQAYYLFRHGFEYWFTSEEATSIEQHNQRFMADSEEQQI